MNKKDKIIIVGAGLCGCLLAIRLAQRGYQINLYERRPDMRLSSGDAGRSINLALSDRGLRALAIAGLKEKVLENTIPMRGRMIHPAEGEDFLSLYSARPSDYINSVSRPGLNILLLNQVEAYDNIELKFDASVIDMDVKAAEIEYVYKGEKKKDKGVVVIGTDGAGSVVRRNLMKYTNELLFNYSQDFLRHGYKELSIHPGPNGTWKLEKEALHIWPRGEFMIIALPNPDGSFTLTMFHPYETEIGFNHLDTEAKVTAFFEEYFPTLLPYIPHYLEEYFANPVGNLGTIKCFPWQAFGKVLVMGDASHAIVPFYGQGMNASLEDVRVFDELLDELGDNWEILFKAFEESRKENADAIAALAIDNFYEMRDAVDDVAFKRKRKIEMQLEQQFPDYYSKYALVTFRGDISYQEAKSRGRRQDEILLKLCKEENFEDMSLDFFYEQVQSA
ncbi:MAG: kynurenine 3-monooxygenase [Neolewinella sp.]|jgi:kynurenine 3-monooxygenase